MEKLSFPHPIPDLASGHLLKMYMHSFKLDENFDMDLTVEMEFWTNDAGAFGIPLADHIDLDPNLSPEQKARLKRQYQNFNRTSSTRGIMVNPTTQEVVNPNYEGVYPKGSIPEKMLWLSVGSSMVPGEKVAEKVFALLTESMGKMVQRGRI